MLSFVLASIIIELTPGPNMTWLAVMGATRGRGMALAAVAGICIGLAIAAVVAGLGLTALLHAIPQLFTALRWAGTFYLFYLAWDAWTDANRTEEFHNGTASRAFMQGLISNILNPKAYLFYAAMLPQFIDSAQDPARQIAMLSGIYVAIATAIHASIAAMAGGLADWLSKSPQAATVRKALALLIAVAAVWFFYSTGISK
jgi:threonine/homoserine/homoserine lactone efflux protein